MLLAGGITVGAQTTNTTTHAKTMSYTLIYEESSKTINNPTEADIRAALNTRISDDFGPVFRIEANGTGELLQVIAMDKNHFSFSYCPNANPDGKDCLFSKKEDLTFDEALKVLLAYHNGSADWKKLVEWKH